MQIDTDGRNGRDRYRTTMETQLRPPGPRKEENPFTADARDSCNTTSGQKDSQATDSVKFLMIAS